MPSSRLLVGGLLVVGLIVVALLRSQGPDPRLRARRPADAVSHTAGTSTTPRPIVRFGVGTGARGASIVRRAGTSGRRPTVVFLHGWGILGRDAYRGWIRHLAAAGNTVIVPRYQRDAGTRPDRVRGNAVAGIRSALARAPATPGTLVLAGHSAGGSLAADLAGSAAAHGLPRPVGVFAAYPGRKIRVAPGAIPEVDPARIAASTRLLALSSAADLVVGEAPARELIARATRISASRRRLVRVTTASIADHLGPTREGKDARLAFWRRLDRLIAQARGPR